MLPSRFSIDGDSRIGLPQCWQEITRIFTRTGAATMETPALWRLREVQLNATNFVCREFESTLPARISFGSALFRRQFRPHRGNVRLSPEASQRTRVTRIVSPSVWRSRRIPGSNWYVMAVIQRRMRQHSRLCCLPQPCGSTNGERESSRPTASIWCNSASNCVQSRGRNWLFSRFSGQ